MDDVRVIDLDLTLDLDRIAGLADEPPAPAADVRVRDVDVELDLDAVGESAADALPAAAQEAAARVEVRDIDVGLDLGAATVVVEVDDDDEPEEGDNPVADEVVSVRDLDLTMDLSSVEQHAVAVVEAVVAEEEQRAREDLRGDDVDALGSVDRVVEATVVLEKDRVREWSMDFGPAWAPAGEQIVLSVQPQCIFRGEKIVATDTGSTPGRGTRIMSVTVAQKIQRPAGDKGTLTQFFSQTGLADGVTFDTADKWAKIAVAVSFVESCTFDMSIFGTAVVDD